MTGTRTGGILASTNCPGGTETVGFKAFEDSRGWISGVQMLFLDGRRVVSHRAGRRIPRFLNYHPISP